MMGDYLVQFCSSVIYNLNLCISIVPLIVGFSSRVVMLLLESLLFKFFFVRGLFINQEKNNALYSFSFGTRFYFLGFEFFYLDTLRESRFFILTRVSSKFFIRFKDHVFLYSRKLFINSSSLSIMFVKFNSFIRKIYNYFTLYYFCKKQLRILESFLYKCIWVFIKRKYTFTYMFGSYLRFRFLRSGVFTINRIQQVSIQRVVLFKDYFSFYLYSIIRVLTLNLFLDELKIRFVGYKCLCNLFIF